MNRPRVGISACLYGQAVRYDGADQRQDAILTHLDRHVQWVPVCPEVGAGYGTPREPIHLERHAGALRLISNDTRRDVTGPMEDYARKEIARLQQLGIVAYVFKARSPSCGIHDVPVIDGEATQENQSGFFVELVRRYMPEILLADENDLADPASRERFLAALVKE